MWRCRVDACPGSIRQSLADHLVLLDHGRPIASGPLNEVLGRIHLPVAFADDAGVVIESVVAEHEADDLTRLEFPGGQIHDVGDHPLLARITRRSAKRLDIRPGLKLSAQIKSVALLG